MKKTIIAVGLLILVAIGTSAAAKETAIKREALPAPVQSALDARYPGAEVLGVSKEKEKGKTFYEVEMKVSGRRVDALFAADGSRQEEEAEIARRADAPGGVVVEMHLGAADLDGVGGAHRGALDHLERRFGDHGDAEEPAPPPQGRSGDGGPRGGDGGGPGGGRDGALPLPEGGGARGGGGLLQAARPWMPVRVLLDHVSQHQAPRSLASSRPAQRLLRGGAGLGGGRVVGPIGRGRVCVPPGLWLRSASGLGMRRFSRASIMRGFEP